MRKSLSVVFLALFTNFVLADDVPENWNVNASALTVEQETTIFNEGTSSAKATWTSTSNQDLDSDEFNVTGGADFSLVVDVNDNDVGGKVRLAVDWSAGNNTYGDYSVDQEGWQTVTLTGTVPAGATTAHVKLRFYDVSAGWDGDAVVYLDNVSFTNGGANLVLNGGFETWVAPPTATAYTIVEIQTPVSDTDDASQHEEELVETSGVITAATSYSFYMQDGTADYSGIYVYNSPGTAVVGDNVTVTGTVSEYLGFTQISSVADIAINSTGNDLPTAIALTTGSLSEGHEGMLVTISGECTAVSTNASSDYWAFKLDDGSGDAFVDDQMFYGVESAATLGTVYDVVGPVNYYHDNFTVNPRDAADVVEETPAGLAESFEGDFPSFGWTNTTISGHAWEQSSTEANGGTYSAKYKGSWGGPHTGELITPRLTLTANSNNSLVYYLKNEEWFGDQNECAVYISTDLGTTWTLITTHNTNIGSFTLYEHDLGSYTQNDSVYIKFLGEDNYGYGVYIDDLTGPPIWVDTDPVATLSPGVLDLGTVFISSSASGDITVTNNGGGTLTGTIASNNTKFALSDFGGSVEPGESATVTVTYTPTEAMADTGYVILTHNGASSPDSVMVTGTGTLDILVEDFDGVWSGDPLAPEGWEVINNDGDSYTWSQSNTYIPEVDGYAAHGMGNQDDWLITPTVTADGDYLLKWFDVVESASNGRNTYDVLVSTDGGVTTDNLGTFDCMNTDLTEHVLSLAAYNGQSVQVSFYQYYSQSNWYGFGIENVSITPAPVVPILSVSTEAVLFMATEVGSARTTTVAITNTGSGDLSGTVAYSDGFTGPASFSGDSLMVVSYSPTTSGIHSGSITITSNGGNATVAVGGNAGGSVATWDDDADGDGYADWPAGWETINNDGGAKEWDFLGGGGHTGDGYTGVGYEYPNDDWLVSPKLDVAAGDMFTFYAGSQSSSWLEDMNVMLSTTGGNTVADFDVSLGEYTSLANGYAPYSYDLSAYAGSQIRVAIVCVSYNALQLNVDDVATSAVYEDAGPVIYDYPLSLNFGTGLLGSSDTLLFDYYNTGGSDLSVTAVTFEESSGAFSLSSTETLPITTEPSAIGSFNVVFSPAADGPNIDTMIVVHNAGDSLRIPVSGNGLNAIYYEDFAGQNDVWSEGWVFSDDGVHCPTDQDCSNGTGEYWYRYPSDNSFMYHDYDGTAADADTAFAPSIVLAPVADHHYELVFTEYMAFGTWADISAVCISTDGGTTYAILTEADYAGSGWSEHTTVNLTAYDDETIQLAFVYQGTNANIWAVDNITIKVVANPVVPIAVVSTPVFPATALGASSSAMLYYANTGSGNLSATITYPASMSGATEITELAPGESDSTVVTYTPTAAGQETEMIVVDGSASGAASVSIAPEANAGELAFDFETSWCYWSQYNLMGFPYGTTPDTWTWYGGANSGHSGNNFAGVYSYVPFWGGVDDYFVSPRLTVETGDVFSFWAKGGYSDGSMRDSMTVYVSSEKPIMGFEYDADGMRTDTGFVNTSMFTEIYTGLPSWDKWDAHEYDLSNSAGDAWLISHSEMNELTGWMLKMDDIAHPNLYQNPNPVLAGRHHFDFGVTSPDGAFDTLSITNTGGADLVIDSMNFIHGDYFEIDESLVFPLTVEPDSSFRFEVVYDPVEFGPTEDTLKYYSNYMTGDEDAYGNGTDMTVFHADSYNNPPNPFDIITPDDGLVIVVTENNMDENIPFVWTTSYDPDGNPVTYLFSVTDTEGEVLDTAMTTVGWIPGPTIGEIAESLLEDEISVMTYSWHVWATDSWDSTAASNGPRNLTIDVSGLLGLDGIGLPDVFALHNNYPNPFNPVTNITYDIPEVAQVTLDIYNISGQKVRTLAQGQHEPGRYRIQWNATNDYGNPLSSGMYIYRIRAGDFVSVKKLILMK